MITQVPMANNQHQVGGYACIPFGSHCTAQGKVTFVGQNGQVTIHLGGDKIITGIPIPRFYRH